MSVCIPDTDDEEEEKLFNEIHISPKTRRSITGRRSIAPGRLLIPPKSEDIVESSDEDDDDFFKMSTGSRSHNSIPDDAVDLSSVHMDSFGLEKSNAESSGNDTAKVHIQSTSTDESKNENSDSSIIELKSSEDDTDDDYVPDIKDVSDFGTITMTSTPGPSKKWLQPKIQNAMKMPKLVSRENYEKKKLELSAARVELKDIIDLYDLMKGKLSDNGAKLKKSSEGLKLKIQQMETEMAELKVKEDNIQEVQVGRAAAEDWSAGINQIQPKFTGKIGLKTHNAQKALTINRLEKLHKALERCPDDNELAKPPPHLKVSLMPHQLHAIKWMRWREKQKPKGGLLADDMGLGKTLTIIALVLDAIYDNGDDKENDNDDEQTDSDSDDDFDDDVDRVRKIKSKKNGGTLIVCPASLVNQWNHEIQTRVKHNKLIVLMHHGNNRQTNLNLICKHDIVMTTYGVISSEHKNNVSLISVGCPADLATILVLHIVNEFLFRLVFVGRIVSH